jgi:hypothetical protein
MSDQAHREANTRRLRLYPWGEVAVGKDQQGNDLDFTVDREFFADLSEFHADHKARGYFSPFAFAHKPGVDGPTQEAFVKALTPGLVTDLGEDQEGVWADVYFAAGVAKLYDDGLLSSVSPSHYTNFKNPHTGKVYKRGLREVSAIGVRHLKDLPTQSGYYQLAEGASWTAITHLEESTMTTPTIEIAAPAALSSEQIAKLIADGIAAALVPVTKTVTALGEQIDALPKVALPTVTTLGEVAETAEQKQIKELKGQVADLDRKAKLAEHRAALMGRLPGADAALVTSLSETLLVAPTHAETQIKAFELVHGAEAIKARGETITILGEQGRQGGAQPKIPLTRAKAEAAAAGKKPGQEQLDWSIAKYGAATLDLNA